MVYSFKSKATEQYFSVVMCLFFYAVKGGSADEILQCNHWKLKKAVEQYVLPLGEKLSRNRLSQLMEVRCSVCNGHFFETASICWLCGWLVGWLVCLLVGWLVGCLFGWLVGWLADWLVGLLIG